MIIDTLTSFVVAGTGQSVTTDAASTNIMDLSVGRDLGIGDNDLNIVVIGDGLWASSGGTATLNIQFQGAPDSSGSPGSYVTFAETGALTITQLNAGGHGGVLFSGSVPVRPIIGANGVGMALPRFLRLNFDNATEAFTAGSILYAGLVLDPEQPTQYPAGFAVAN